jgi:periplasmic protein TonB
MNLKKSESANLENKRAIFFETGMIIALILVFYAFNWKTYEKESIQAFQRIADNTPIELVPVTVQKPPEPPKIQPPKVLTIIRIVDNDSPVDDEFTFSAEIDPMDTVPLYVPAPVMKEEEPPEEEEIFRVVEARPEFPGGDAALYAFLYKNMTYPGLAKEAGISGKVYVTFVVEKDGSITDVRVLRGIGGGCDEEAMRVVKNMPRWTPGKQRNIPVRVQFILDVKFTLSQM